MRTVKTNQGISTSSLDEVDDLVIELRNALTPSTVEFQELNAILYTNGYTGIQFPNLAAGSYYVVVKHRNAIQTWSANPVQVADILFYDFTTAASQAYGSNQIEVEPGVFAFYSGDINQDESVDNSDSDLLFDDINNSNYGYLATDLNGDGSVDNSELDFFIPNSINSIYSMHP